MRILRVEEAIAMMPEAVKALRPLHFHIPTVVAYDWLGIRREFALGWVHWFKDYQNEIAIQYVAPLAEGVIYFDPPRIWPAETRAASDGVWHGIHYCSVCSAPSHWCSSMEHPHVCNECSADDPSAFEED